MHEEYNRVEFINDIALLRLKTEVVLEGKRYIETICLPVAPCQNADDLGEEEDAMRMIISGWGQTEFSQSMSDVLLQAKVKYINNQDCVEKFDRIKSRFETITIDISENHLVRLV